LLLILQVRISMIFSASGRPGSSKARLAGWWDGARHIEPDGVFRSIDWSLQPKIVKIDFET
jgi:hypothetical protein